MSRFPIIVRSRVNGHTIEVVACPLAACSSRSPEFAHVRSAATGILAFWASWHPVTWNAYVLRRRSGWTP